MNTLQLFSASVIIVLYAASACGSQQQPDSTTPDPQPQHQPSSHDGQSEPAAAAPASAEPASAAAPDPAAPPADTLNPRAPQAPESVAAPPKEAQTTKTGLRYLIVRHGSGKVRPAAGAKLEVHYSGWTTDGKLFDSSVERGTPFSFELGHVIPGFAEGVQLMVEGDKALLWIPEELAYKGKPGVPAGMLVFEIELLRIIQ